MSDKNEPAFPVPMVSCDNQGGFTEVRFAGLSIRDYFAAKALQGMLATDVKYSKEAYAEMAYMFADCMMKERAE